MTGPVTKPPRLTFYAYGVVDVKADPPELIEVKLSRNAAREFVQWREDADRLRIRRGDFKLFSK